MVPERFPVGPDTDAILLAVESAHRAMATVAHAAIRRQAPELSAGEFAILRFLSLAGLQRVTDLGDALAVAPSTLTRHCDHLARISLISRQREAHDRREVRLGLTPAGRSVVSRIVAEQNRALSARFDRLSESERRQLVRIAGKLAREIDDQQPLRQRTTG